MGQSLRSVAGAVAAMDKRNGFILEVFRNRVNVSAICMLKMQPNAYNLITFQGSAYTDGAVLEIIPRPDALLRVFMAYKPLIKRMELPPQELKPFKRRGFTVVEWGGACVE